MGCWLFQSWIEVPHSLWGAASVVVKTVAASGKISRLASAFVEESSNLKSIFLWQLKDAKKNVKPSANTESTYLIFQTFKKLFISWHCPFKTVNLFLNIFCSSLGQKVGLEEHWKTVESLGKFWEWSGSATKKMVKQMFINIIFKGPDSDPTPDPYPYYYMTSRNFIEKSHGCWTMRKKIFFWYLLVEVK